VLGLSQGAVLRQVDPALTRAGVLRAERVLVRMAGFVGERRIEDLPIPFTAVAVDLLTGREVAALPLRLTSRRPGAAPSPQDGDIDSESPPSIGMHEVLSLSLDASQSALTRYSLAAHVPDVLITVPKDACRTADFHKAAELIDLGRDLACQALGQAHLENA